MDTQMAHSGTGEDDQHHEKTSTFQKMKAKARKIKSSFGHKKHGDHDVDDAVDDDDEEELLEEEPEVHGAPKHESAAASKYALPEVHGTPMHESPAASKYVDPHKVGSEQPTVLGHLPPVAELPSHGSSDPIRKGNQHPTNVSHPTTADKPKVDFGHSSSPMEVDPIRNVHRTDVTHPPANAAGSHLESDPNRIRNASPGNYHTDVTYPPTGAALSDQLKGSLGILAPLKETHGSEQPKGNLGHLLPADMHPHGSDQPRGNLGVLSPVEKHSDQPRGNLGVLSPVEKKHPHGSDQPRGNLGILSPVEKHSDQPRGSLGHLSPVEKHSDQPRGSLGNLSPPEKHTHASEQPRGNLGNLSPPEKHTHASEQPRGNLSNLLPVEKYPHGSEQPRGNLGHLSPVEKDPHGLKDPLRNLSPGNNQSKVTDPIYGGGKEVDHVKPIISSFEKMQVKSDEPEVRSQKTSLSPMGSHDQFSPDYSPIPHSNMDTSGNPRSVPLPQSFNNESEESREGTTHVGEHQPTNQASSYTEKLSYATSAIAGTAISAKNVVASKLGYGNENEGMVAGTHDTSRTTHTMDRGTNDSPRAVGTNDTPITTPTSRTGVVAGTTEYGKQIASTVYDKVAGAGSAVASKMPGMGSGGSVAVTDQNEGTRALDTPTTGTHAHDTPKAGPGMVAKVAGAGSAVISKIPGMGSGGSAAVTGQNEGTRALDTPTVGTHAHDTPKAGPGIVAKVAGAGSAVISKIPGMGSGGAAVTDQNEGTRALDTPTAGTHAHDTSKAGPGMVAGTAEYGKQMASTVYNTVTGAGGAVVSKVKGTGSAGNDADAVTGTTTGPKMDTGSVAGKGVPAKGYLAEKFSPGEDDKALSEMITGALHKSDEDKQKEHSKKVEEAMGRVTESEQVPKRLGTDDGAHHGSGDGSDVVVGGGAGSGVGMVGRLTGTVASWFGGNSADQTHPTSESHSPNSSNAGKQEHDLLAASHHEGDTTATSHGNAGGERRLL